MSKIPTYPANIYAPAALIEPYEHYRRIRDAGPVVRLSRHRTLALGRYADVRSALGDDSTFISGQGVGLNPVANKLSKGTTLNSDGDVHTRRRSLLASELTPRALRPLQSSVRARADEIVDAAVNKGRIDAVADLARALPLSIVPDLIGWPQEGRDDLLRWAGATFDVLGPLNTRMIRGCPATAQMLSFARRTVNANTLMRDTLGSRLLDAADKGELRRTECPALLVDYLAPSLDTTISAISSAIWLFTQHPDQWTAITEDPTLITGAVNEVVRFESPLRAFSRVTSHDVEVDGVSIARGTRVLMMYASANRDERKWNDPNTFDITRSATDHVGFGYGVHGCAGQGLARMETTAILQALSSRVIRFDSTGIPVRGLNNIIRGFSQLPVRLITANPGV